MMRPAPEAKSRMFSAPVRPAASSAMLIARSAGGPGDEVEVRVVDLHRVVLERPRGLRRGAPRRGTRSPAPGFWARSGTRGSVRAAMSEARLEAEAAAQRASVPGAVAQADPHAGAHPLAGGTSARIRRSSARERRSRSARRLRAGIERDPEARARVRAGGDHARRSRGRGRTRRSGRGRSVRGRAAPAPRRRSRQAGCAGLACRPAGAARSPGCRAAASPGTTHGWRRS